MVQTQADIFAQGTCKYNGIIGIKQMVIEQRYSASAPCAISGMCIHLNFVLSQVVDGSEGKASIDPFW